MVFGEEIDKEPTILSTLGLGTVIVTIDIPTLLADAERAVDASRALYRLIEQLAHDSHFLCTIRLGTQNVHEAEALHILATQASERGFLLDDRVMHTSEDHSDVFRDAMDDARPATSSELDEDEWLFLEEAGINWPVSHKTLERVWREVAFAAHPDRHANDPSAQLRFVRLKNAFERLKSRIEHHD